MFSATIDVNFFRKLNYFILNEVKIVMDLSPLQRDLFPHLEEQVSERVRRAWLAMVEQGSTRSTVEVEDVVLQGVEEQDLPPESQELLVRVAHSTIYAEVYSAFGVDLQRLELLFPRR